MRVRGPGAARDFSPGAKVQRRLFYGVAYSPHVQLHASASESMLKISNTGSHAAV